SARSIRASRAATRRRCPRGAAARASRRAVNGSRDIGSRSERDDAVRDDDDDDVQPKPDAPKIRESTHEETSAGNEERIVPSFGTTFFLH
ncbi:hypothetical protein X777_14054, partial [Ooceraea biroi]